MADEVTTPAAPALQPGPWENDIRQSFTDPQVAAQVDNFLRARVQPRVTQLEQQVAQTKDATELWDAFHSNPEGTFNAIRAQLVEAGYDVAEANAIAGNAQAEAAAAPPPAAQTAAAQAEDPRVAEMYADWTRTRELSAYDAEIERITADPANADIDPNLYHTYVSAADGDFEQAINMYRHHVTNILTRYGIDPAEATLQQAQAAAQVAEGEQRQESGAPPVMGQGAGGAGAPVPTQPEYQGRDGLHKAIEDATAQMMRKAAPSTLG